MPKQTSNLAGMELVGFEAIRSAIVYIEDLRRKGTNAHIEVFSLDTNSGEYVTISSFEELQEYISHCFSRMLLDDVHSAIPLDDFERLVIDTTTHLLQDTDRIHGRIIIES